MCVVQMYLIKRHINFFSLNINGPFSFVVFSLTEVRDTTYTGYSDIINEITEAVSKENKRSDY